MTFLAYTKGNNTSIIEYNGPKLENVCKIIPGTIIVNATLQQVKDMIDANGGFLKQADGTCYSNCAVNGAPSYYLMNGFEAVVYDGDAIRIYCDKKERRAKFNFQNLTPCTFISSYAGHIFNCEASSYAYVYGGILQTFEVPTTALATQTADCLIYDKFKLVGMVNPHAQRIPWIKLPQNEKMCEVLAAYLLKLMDSDKAASLSAISPDTMFNVQGGAYALLKTDAISSHVKKISDQLFQEADYTKVPDFGPCTKYLGIQPTKDIYEGRLVAALTPEHMKNVQGDVLAYVYDGEVGDAHINDLQSETACVHYAIINSDLNVFLKNLDNAITAADIQFFKSYSDMLRTKIKALNPAVDQYFDEQLIKKLSEATGIPVSTEGSHIEFVLPVGTTKGDVDAMLQSFAFDFDSKSHCPTFGQKFKQKVAEFADTVSGDSQTKMAAFDAWKEGAYPMNGTYYLVSSGVNGFEPSGCDGVYPLTVPAPKSRMLTAKKLMVICNSETHTYTLRVIANVYPAIMQAYTEISGGDYSRLLCSKILQNFADTMAQANVECNVTLRNPIGVDTCGTKNPFGWKSTSYQKSKARRCGAVALGVLTAGISAAFGVTGKLTRWGSYADDDPDFDPMSIFEAYIDFPLTAKTNWNKQIDSKIDVYKLYEDFRLDSIAQAIAPMIEDLLGAVKDATVDKWFCLVRDSMVYSIFTGLLHSDMYVSYSVIQALLAKFDLYRQQGLLTDDIKSFLDNMVNQIKTQYDGVDLQLGIDTKLYNVESFDSAQKGAGDAESFALYNYMED